MKADDPRTAVARLRKKKGNLSVKRVTDCGTYYQFESSSRLAPSETFKVMKKSGRVKKVKRKLTPAEKKRKTAAAAAGGILKAVFQKVMDR